MLQQWKTCLSGQELGWVCTRTHTANLYGEILRLFCWYKKLQKTDLKPPTDVYMSGNKWKHLKWNYILFTHLRKKPKQSLYPFNFHFVICLSGVCYTGGCLCSFVDLGVWFLTGCIDCEILGAVMVKQVKLLFSFHFHKLYCKLHWSEGLQ